MKENFQYLINKMKLAKKNFLFFFFCQNQKNSSFCRRVKGGGIKFSWVMFHVAGDYDQARVYSLLLTPLLLLALCSSASNWKHSSVRARFSRSAEVGERRDNCRTWLATNMPDQGISGYSNQMVNNNF